MGKGARAWVQVQRAGIRDPHDRVPGMAPSPEPKKGPLRPPDYTVGDFFLQPTRPTCTPCPRFCTRSTRLDEGYQKRLGACELGHPSIFYGRKTAWEIFILHW